MNNEEKVKEIKDLVHKKHGFSSTVTKALNDLDTILMTLDALFAEYDIAYSDDYITISVEPAISYNAVKFWIDVTDNGILITRTKKFD